MSGKEPIFSTSSPGTISLTRSRSSTFCLGVERLTLFPQYRIDLVDSLSPPEVRPYVPGTPLSSTANSPITVTYPLNVHPRYKNEYFVPKQSFNIMGMLQSPMIMMMGVVGLMVLALPYMMVGIPFVPNRFSKLMAIWTRCLEKPRP